MELPRLLPVFLPVAIVMAVVAGIVARFNFFFCLVVSSSGLHRSAVGILSMFSVVFVSVFVVVDGARYGQIDSRWVSRSCAALGYLELLYLIKAVNCQCAQTKTIQPKTISSSFSPHGHLSDNNL